MGPASATPRGVLAAALLTGACAHIPDPEAPGVADGAPIETVRLEGASAIDEDALVSGLANRPPEFVLIRLGEGMVLTDRYFRYDDLQTELDRRRIRSFYERYGYFATTISGPEVKENDEGRVEITWKIDEGAPARVSTVAIQNAPQGLAQRLRDATGIEPGDIYESGAFETAEGKLRAVLFREGYATAEVEGETQIDREDGAAAVVFEVRSGPLLHMGDLSVDGAVRTPTSAIEARKTWEEGEVFDPPELEQLRGRLYAIDMFAGVRFDYATPPLIDGDTTEVVARVEELPENELQLGVGGGIDQTNISLRLRGRYKRRNFPLPLTNLVIDVTPAVQFLREGGAGGFSDPTFAPKARATVVWYDFLFPRLELASDVGYEFQQLEPYRWQGPDVGQTLSRPFIDDRLRVGLGWRFHQYFYADPRVFGADSELAPPFDENPTGIPDFQSSPTPQQILNITGSASVFVLNPAITFDSRDDPLNPRNGFFGSLSFEAGLATGQEGAGFLLLSPEVRGYLPLGDRLVVAARANLTTNLQGELPAPRRLFAGGATSQRGFPQRRLGPSAALLEQARDDDTLLEAADGDPLLEPTFRGDCDPSDPASVASADCEAVLIPIGGESLLELNLELRLRLFKLFGFWFGLAAFLDGADLAPTLSEIQFPNLHYAAGGGLRYITPIGAVRVDYGYRLNRQRDSFSCVAGTVSCGAFHISLGQAF